MLEKMDRQGARTPADLERKYNFTEMKKNINAAQKELEQIKTQINELLVSIAEIKAHLGI